jgi:lipopolysaccharide export system permease protein
VIVSERAIHPLILGSLTSLEYPAAATALEGHRAERLAICLTHYGPRHLPGEVMRIIDRYLLRQFGWTFLVCYLSLTGLYVVFDAFTNLEEFLRYAEKQGGLLSVLGSFYAYKSIGCFDRTAGLLTLVAAMFTVTWIQRHNELVALMSAGISRVRVVAPVIVGALALIFLAAANRELVIPRFREQLAQRPQDLVGDVGKSVTPRYDNQTDILIKGQRAYPDQQRIVEPKFLLPPALSQYGNLLAAKEAFYTPPHDGRPGGYLMKGLQEPRGLDAASSLTLAGRPVIITPHDAAEWLGRNQCFVVSGLSLEQLTNGDALRQYASTAELIAGLRNRSLDFGADVRVAIHSRLVQPLLDATLLLLGLPIVLRRENRNVFIAIGLSAVLVALFLLVVMGFQHLGSIYALSPALAAWGPLIIFVPVAAAMSETMWK